MAYPLAGEKVGPIQGDTRRLSPTLRPLDVKCVTYAIFCLPECLFAGLLETPYWPPEAFIGQDARPTTCGKGPASTHSQTQLVTQLAMPFLVLPVEQCRVL